MILHQRFHGFLAMMLVILSHLPGMAQANEQLVRLALIEVDTAQLNTYNELLEEEIEDSIIKEPGVITLYGVAERDNPHRISLFETYADSSAYRSHLATPHFQKYKKGTLQMVTKLQLIEAEPIFYVRKAELSDVPAQELFIRLITLQIDSTRIDDFIALGIKVMLPGIKREPGVLVMYAVAERKHKSTVSILEVYSGIQAYEKHIRTPHFLNYKRVSKSMIKTQELIDVKPIMLGSKPQN